MKLCRILVLLTLFCCPFAYGQFGSLKTLGKKALQKTQEKKEPPPAETKPAQPTNPSTTNPSSSTNSGTASTSSPSANASAGATTTSSSATGSQPQLVAVKADFIPGEKTIFLDDFSDMPPGEAPPHWKVRGGATELHMGGGVRELWSNTGPTLISQPIAFPADFTFEMTFTNGGPNMTWHFQTQDDKDVLVIRTNTSSSADSMAGDVETEKETIGNIMSFAYDKSQPIEFALWAQQGRVRVYFNGKPYVDANQVHFGKIDHFRMEIQSGYAFGLRRVRVAECAPDPSKMFASTGKYVTHGIYFDTDSDILKPESAPVIKQISSALYKDPSLKLEIDGYTDSTGEAAHNLDLSKRRAAAVASVLVSQFGIDQGRLTSNGFGAQNPIASNDTPDGRAENRRVEFVKK